MSSDLLVSTWLEEEGLAHLLHFFEESLCAAVLLCHILYRCTSKKSQSVASSRAEAVKFVIQTVPLGTDVAQAAQKKEVKYKQPFLLALGPERRPNQFVMVVDNLSIPVGQATVTAIDTLFKAYYCFNVEYPTTTSQFWEFLASEVYGVLPKKNAKPHVRTLATVIKGLEMPSNELTHHHQF